MDIAWIIHVRGPDVWVFRKMATFPMLSSEHRSVGLGLGLFWPIASFW
jgi:hypothetical protein